MVGPTDPRPAGPSTSATVFHREVPRFLNDLHDAAPWYRPSDALVDAVNVALAVGAPLLLTGEPGSGKTQLAYHLAWYFNLQAEPEDLGRATDGDRRQPFVFHTRSTSLATELLYRFDTVQYFHDAREQSGTLHKHRYISKGPLWRAFDRLEAGDPAIVLIDEVDKAPRDFPNDLLHELSQYEFTVAETGKSQKFSKKADPPLVILTSNEERRLPDAFLRRCVYHHIRVERQTFVDAADAHIRRLLGRAPGDPAPLPEPAAALTQAAVEVVHRLHQDNTLQKRPSTAELLAWLTALVRGGRDVGDLGVARDRLPFLGVLLKDQADLRPRRA
jgi:MoxR-like ATPase